MFASNIPTGVLSDDDLERRVVSFLEARHVPGIRWIEVTAAHGIVRLTGTVRSFYQRQLCTHCVRRVAGVVDVIDDLTVA